MISTESSEQATWRVVSYKKIVEDKELQAIMTRMQQTGEMRANANKTREPLKGTPLKRQKKMEDSSDFSTPRLGVYDVTSPDIK